MTLTGDHRESEDTTDLSTGVAVAKLNYTDIQRLSNADLNEYCRHFNIDISLPKAVKVNAICHCCDISTTGESQPSLTLTTLPRTAESLDKSQLLELQSMTPKVLYSLTDWSSDISTIPNVDETDVKRFLLQTDTLRFDSERTYKLSRPYQLKQFGREGDGRGQKGYGREGMEWDDESVCEGNGEEKKSKTPLSNSWIRS